MSQVDRGLQGLKQSVEMTQTVVHIGGDAASIDADSKALSDKSITAFCKRLATC